MHTNQHTHTHTRGMVSIRNPKDASAPNKDFTFDSVFGQNSVQADVYNKTARRIVESVLEGYNGNYKAV